MLSIGIEAEIFAARGPSASTVDSTINVIGTVPNVHSRVAPRLTSSPAIDWVLHKRSECDLFLSLTNRLLLGHDRECCIAAIKSRWLAQNPRCPAQSAACRGVVSGQWIAAKLRHWHFAGTQQRPQANVKLKPHEKPGQIADGGQTCGARQSIPKVCQREWANRKLHDRLHVPDAGTGNRPKAQTRIQTVWMPCEAQSGLVGLFETQPATNKLVHLHRHLV